VVDASYSTESVHLDVGVRPRGGDQDCQGNPDTHYDVKLSEPLGRRTVVGQTWPATYAIVTNDDWSLQEAVDPPEDDPFASAERPPMDWYAEYVRTLPVPGGSEGQMVRLSGHATPISDTRAALTQLGWDFTAIQIEGWDGLGGTNPTDPASPPIVLLEDPGATTLMLLSYELSLDEVAAFAESVEITDEEAWVGAGGVIRSR
jgi:hypothetical protein